MSFVRSYIMFRATLNTRQSINRSINHLVRSFSYLFVCSFACLFVSSTLPSYPCFLNLFLPSFFPFSIRPFLPPSSYFHFFFISVGFYSCCFVFRAVFIRSALMHRLVHLSMISRSFFN